MEHSIDASVTEAAGNKNAVDISQLFCDIVRRNGFGINPFQVNDAAVGNTAVFQGFYNADIGVVKAAYICRQAQS